MDFSWVDTVVGAGTAVTAYVVGQARGRSSRRTERWPDPEPVCGCEHHYSLHDADDVCHGTVRVVTEVGQGGKKWSHHACGCQRYTGPEPLPRYVP